MISLKLKSEMLAFIRKPLPSNLPIVDKSIPVLFFGDIETARYATISINPSGKEFLAQDGSLLPMNQKRFVDRDALKVNSDATLDNTQAQAVYDSLRGYFKKNPYWSWFHFLEDFFTGMPNKISYTNGNLVHINISPWATTHSWEKLTQKQQNDLTAAGDDLIQKILNDGQIQYLFVNGKTALDYVDKHIVNKNITPLSNNKILLYVPCEIKVGQYGTLKIVGWSNSLTGPMITESREKLSKEILPLIN